MGWVVDAVTGLVKWDLKGDLQRYYDSIGGVAGAEFDFQREASEEVVALLPGGKDPHEAHAELEEARAARRAEWDAQRAHGQKADGLLGYLGQGVTVAGAWTGGALAGVLSGVEAEAAPPASSLLVTPVPGGHFQSTRELVADIRGERAPSMPAPLSTAEERAELRDAKRAARDQRVKAGAKKKADANAAEAGSVVVPGVGVPSGSGDEEGDAGGGAGAHAVPSRAGALEASASPGVKLSANAKREKARKVAEAMKRSDAENRARADARRAARRGDAPAVVADIVPAPVPVRGASPMPDESPSLSVFDRMKDAAEGATSKIREAVGGLPSPSEGGLSTSALPLVAVGATAVGATGGALLAHQLGDADPPRSRPQSSKRKKASSKKASAKKPAKKASAKKAKAPKGATRVKSDRSGRTRTKNTWHGKPVYKDANGRFFVVTNKPFKGARRFVKM